MILGGLSIYILSDKEFYYPYRLISTLSLIQEYYPESYNRTAMLNMARDAVISRLDRYSGYLEPAEFNRVSEEFSGSYGGIGITVVGHTHGLMIMSVREDGPAARAGIRTGDIIIRVDSIDMEKVNPYQASYYLRGPEGTSLNVIITRNDLEDTLTFKLSREELKLIHVPYAGTTSKKNLYIRILDFETGTADEVRAVLDSLYGKEGDSINGIILDLRGNPGGLLSEAVSIADMFLKKGHLIVGIKGRSRWHKAAFYASASDITNDLPIGIIVDRGSASASEILSGALKYAGRAFLVGDTTFGKGLVQEFDNLSDGSALRLTTARYFFEGNIFLNNPEDSIKDSAAGIPPDYYVNSVENERFPIWLENSFLMREFAVSHQDEIIGDFANPVGSSGIFDSLTAYIFRDRFDYESDLTGIVKFARDEVIYGGYSIETQQAIDRIYALAKSNDSSQFLYYKDYIKQRLYQVALETKYGSGAAYRDAILPFRQDIALTEKIIADRKQH